MLWFRWLRTYLSKAAMIGNHGDGPFDGLTVVAALVFVVWIEPQVIGLAALFLGGAVELEMVVIRDIRKATGAAGFRVRVIFFVYTAAALGCGLLPYFAMSSIGGVRTRADALGLDGTAAELTSTIALLTVLTAVMTVVYRQAERVLENFAPPVELPGGVKKWVELVADARRMRERASLVYETTWTLVAVTIALVPSVFHASLGPNLVAGFIVPLLIVHARDDYRRFRTPTTGKHNVSDD